MVDPCKAAQLYTLAYEMAAGTPEIGGRLARNCTTVHFGMLQHARNIFGSPVDFVIGHIEVDGEVQFAFTDDEVAAWRSGMKKPRYNLHAWLAVGNDILDLTLAPTLFEADPGLLPGSLTYLDLELARKHGIAYFPRLQGDCLLLELGMVRAQRS